MSGRPTPAGWVALAAGAACLPFLPLLVAGETLWFRDFSLYFVPMKALLADLWRGGHLPLWDPSVRNGMPFLANPQTGVLYPPSALLVLFGVNPGLTLFILFHLAVAGAGFYLFAREARFPEPAALVGAAAFGLGGYVASLVSVLNNLQAVAWVPWILLFVMRLRGGGGRGVWLGLVAAAALAILGGELQLAAIGFALAGGLALAVGGRPERGAAGAGEAEGRVAGAARTASLLVSGVAVAACLTAFQLLPTAELLRESVRREGLPFDMAADDSLPPASLATLALPRPALPGDAETGALVTKPLPWLLSAYMGAAVAVLAVAGAFGPRQRWTLFWAGAAGLGIALALGRHSVVFRLAYDLLPPFRSLRFPEKFLLLPALALPALAAAGVERLLKRDIRPRDLATGLAVVALSGAASLLWMDPAARPAPDVALAHGTVAAAAAAGLCLAARARRLSPGSASTMLTALVVLDLGLAARAVNPSVPWRFYEERPWADRILEERGEDPREYRIRSSPLAANMEQVAVVGRARVFSNHWFFQQSMAPNLGQLYGWLAQDGMAGIETRGTAHLIDALVGLDAPEAMRFLRLMSVRYAVTSFPLPEEDVTPVARHPELPISVVRVRGALPRAYLASRWEVIADPAAALARALEGGFRPESEVVLDSEPEWAATAVAGRPATARASPTEAAASPAGSVVRAVWDPSSARFDVDAPASAVLVVTDSWYPGWRAELDGREAAVLRANGYGRAVAVPPGRHQVFLRYAPESFALGAAVSLVSAALLGALALAGCVRRRPAPARPFSAQPPTLDSPTSGSAQDRATRKPSASDPSPRARPRKQPSELQQ